MCIYVCAVDSADDECKEHSLRMQQRWRERQRGNASSKGGCYIVVLHAILFLAILFSTGLSRDMSLQIKKSWLIFHESFNQAKTCVWKERSELLLAYIQQHTSRKRERERGQSNLNTRRKRPRHYNGRDRFHLSLKSQLSPFQWHFIHTHVEVGTYLNILP